MMVQEMEGEDVVQDDEWMRGDERNSAIEAKGEAKSEERQ